MFPECDNKENRLNKENFSMISVVEELKPQAYISTAIASVPTIDQIIKMNISLKHYKQPSYRRSINN
ncbi:MAG: hypothetical protein MUO34_02100 [Ignavibacteriaceae bacterium]|nr:hypothetical protein [Ignavibacteriaceae bacterium]